MMNDIYKCNITKLPDAVDPGTLIRQEVIRKFGYNCPCCGETMKMVDYMMSHPNDKDGGILVDNYPDDTYKAKIDGKRHFFRFWEKTYDWVVLKAHCLTCNAKWTLPAFPIIHLTMKEVNEIWTRICERNDKND